MKCDQDWSDPQSRARTHLANERTFLAWLRTGITMAALGLAAAQFLTHDLIPGIPLTRGLAIVLVGFGVFVALAGARRYIVTEKRIDCGEYRPARTSVLIASVLVALVGGLSVLFITLIPR